MKNYKLLEFCPECGIGINREEAYVRCCKNCRAQWDEEDEILDDFKTESIFPKSLIWKEK